MSRTYLAAAAALFVVGGAAVTGTAVAADAADKPITMSFTAERSGVVVLSKSAYTLADTDVQHGKKIGLDSLSCTDTSGTTSHCKVAFATSGGILLAAFTLDDATGSLQGHVSGGSGAFTHASGTITGQAVSRTDILVKLVYTR